MLGVQYLVLEGYKKEVILLTLGKNTVGQVDKGGFLLCVLCNI